MIQHSTALRYDYTTASAVPTGSRFSRAVQTWANFWIDSRDRNCYGPAQLGEFGESQQHTAIYQLCRKIELFKTAYLDNVDKAFNENEKGSERFPSVMFSTFREHARIDQWFLEVLQQSPTAGILYSHETELRSPTSPDLHLWLWRNLAYWVEEPQDSISSGLGPLSDGAVDSRDDLEHHEDNSTGRGKEKDQGLSIRPRSLPETTFNTSDFSASGHAHEYDPGRIDPPLDRQSSLPTMSRKTVGELEYVQNLATPPNVTTSRMKHECPHCETEFIRHHDLKSHMLTHQEKSPYLCLTCFKKFGRPHDLMHHMKLHVRSTQDSGGNTGLTSPVNIPSSFHVDDSQSNSKRFWSMMDLGTWPPGQVPDKTSERLNRDMQSPRSFGFCASNDIENTYPRYDIHSSEMGDVITSNPKKRKNPFGESKDIRRPTSEESKSFSEFFGVMLKYQIGTQCIRFPEGLEDDMTVRVVELAEQAFWLYGGLHGDP
jgi:hypothetical protein